jgi:hypothetical protein
MATTVLQMLRASPGTSFTDDRVLAECILLAAECAQACAACADACLGEREVEQLRRCIRFDLDCADICESAGRLLLRPHDPAPEVLRHLLEVVAIACRACADECDRHAERYQHCRLCREVCLRCAETCTRLRETLDRLAAGSSTQH